MVEVSNNFKQECEANVGAYKFGKIKVNYIDDNLLNYEQGAYSSSSGAKIEDNQSIRSVNLVECKPSFKYKIELGNSAYKMKIITYTEAQAFIATHDNLVDGNEVTTEATAKYLSVTIYSTDILEGTSILLNGTSRNGALTGAELQGDTSQNGTPTPSSPIKVNNVTGLQKVRVCGKNILPQDKYLNSIIVNGITYTNNRDGTFNISGTATANTSIVIIPIGNIELEASQPYYFYSSVPYNGTTFNMSIPMTDNGTTKFLLANNTYTPTTMPTNVRLQFYIASGQSIDQTNIKLMLVKGSTRPTEYEKYQGKDYEINLGANILDLQNSWVNSKNSTQNGLHYVLNADDTISISGTSTNYSGTYARNYNSTDVFMTLKANHKYRLLVEISNKTSNINSRIFFGKAGENISDFSIPTMATNGTYYKDYIPTEDVGLTQYSIIGAQIVGETSLTMKVAIYDITTNLIDKYTKYFTPIELNKIGNYQDYIRKGAGKNLINSNTTTRTLLGITLTNNGDGTYTANGTSTGQGGIPLTITPTDIKLKKGVPYTYSIEVISGTGNATSPIAVYKEDGTTQYNYFVVRPYQGQYSVTNTPTEDLVVREIVLFFAKGITINNLRFKIQLEQNSQATSYEPFGYKDKWYIEKNSNKVALDGSTTIERVPTTTSGVYRFSVVGPTDMKTTTNVSGKSNLLFSNKFVEISNGQSYSETMQGMLVRANNSNQFIINCDETNDYTASQFKTWLESNNIEVTYVLANPTYTLIDNEELIEQLDRISHAETQEEITNILVAGNLPATIEIERDLTDSIKGRQLRPFIGYSITGDDDLISFKITGKADSSKSFIGSCVTKQIDLEIFNAENKHNLENKQIIVSTGMAETAGNFVTFEPFTITGTKDNKTKDKINYVGYDDMYKLNTAYVDTNTYGEDGITLYSFLESLASNANTSLGNESIPNGDFIVDGNPFTNNETNMFALSQVAKLSGGFAEIGRDNKIYIKTLDQDTPTMTLDTNLYSEDFEKAENFGAVNKVVVGESNISGNEAILSDLEDIELNGEHVVEILDSYFLSDDADKQIICAELFDRLKGLYYLPFSATCNGFPYLDLGDVIEIEDKNGDTYLTYLLNYELSYNGGYKEKIGAEAQSSTETKYKNVNTIKDKFKQVEIIVDKANAEIQSVIKKSDNNYTSITQTIGGITTQVQTATTTAGNAMTAVGNLAQGTQRQFNGLTEALSRLSQSVNNIQALFRVTGGANLIQNSVGFFQNSSGAPTMWNVSQGIAGFKHGYDSELLGQTTSQGKFYIRNGTISTTENDATLETEANISGIEIGSLVTLSFKYKQSADSTTTITLANGETTFFTATFSEEVEDWTSYSDADNTNSFTCTTDSLVLTITNTSTYNTDDQGFMISDLILNYGEAKTWELHSGESYGGVIQLSSQGISVKSSSANTITYMTSDGIEVFETTQGDVLGDLITKLTSNGIETKDFVATGDITTRNLITTMIKDTSNNDIYIEYIKDE